MPEKPIFDGINLEVPFHGVTLRSEDLMPGMLVCGASGSGKTTTAVNTLVAAAAGVHANDPRRKPAIIYFVVKGSPQEDLLGRLPIKRRADVITVGSGPGGSHHLRLMPARCWDRDEAQAAASELIVEHQRHLSHSPDIGGGHKAYWEAQNRSVLHALRGLRHHDRGEDTDTDGPFCPDGVRKLAWRTRYAARHLEAMERCRQSQRAATREAVLRVLGVADEERAAHLAQWLEQAASRTGEETDDDGKQALLNAVAEVLRAGDGALPEPGSGIRSDLAAFHEQLDFRSAKALADLIRAHAGAGDNMLYSLTSGLENMVEPILESRLFAPGGRRAISYEEVIDRGKILVLELPLASGGDAARSDLIAASLGFFVTAAARARLRAPCGRPLNRSRPVLLVLDEFHLAVSRGRHSGLARFVSICRESGVGCVLPIFYSLKTTNIEHQQVMQAEHPCGTTFPPSENSLRGSWAAALLRRPGGRAVRRRRGCCGTGSSGLGALLPLRGGCPSRGGFPSIRSPGPFLRDGFPVPV